jgi:hypothetical protein
LDCKPILPAAVDLCTRYDSRWMVSAASGNGVGLGSIEDTNALERPFPWSGCSYSLRPRDVPPGAVYLTPDVL